MVGFPRRLLESFLLPVLLSALCMLGRKASIIPSATIAAGACILAILVFNYLNMTDYLFEVRREDIFYKTNFAVFGVGFAFSMILTVIDVIVDLGVAYSFLCLPYEVLANLGVPKIFSALIINALFALEVLLMPYIAMKKRR
ncbi:MAG: hypothetical protein IKU84_07570 [Clostridia bacterium]|nr:hypothetical protein [Clostridia bacterium]